MNKEEKEVILEVKNISIAFGKGKKAFKAIDNVSFNIYKGETFGLVGESGSGKTTIGRAIIRINETSEGDILFKGKKINGKISREMDKEVTRKLQMIFQDPMASLNERAKVDYIVSEGLYNTKNFKNDSDRKAKVEKALLDVGLLPEFSSRFPHEFSGGQTKLKPREIKREGIRILSTLGKGNFGEVSKGSLQESRHIPGYLRNLHYRHILDYLCNLHCLQIQKNPDYQ